MAKKQKIETNKLTNVSPWLLIKNVDTIAIKQTAVREKIKGFPNRKKMW